MSEEPTQSEVWNLLKATLPELNLESVEQPEANSMEDMQNRLDIMEKNISGLTEALNATVVLYEEARKEAEILRASHEGAKASASQMTEKLAIDLKHLFKLDYNELVLQMAETGTLDVPKMAEVIKTTMEKTSEVQKFQKKIAALVEESMDIDTSDMEIDYGDLSEHIDYDNIAYNLCYSTLSDYMSFDPTDYWDSSDLAQYFGEDDIAQYIDTESVAGYVDTDEIASEIDLDEIAGKINVESLAAEIDLDELALFMSQNIDLDDLAQRIRGEEE